MPKTIDLPPLNIVDFLASSEPMPESVEARDLKPEEEVTDSLPITLRGIIAVVKMKGFTVERWIGREHWEVGYESIGELLDKGDEATVVSFLHKWSDPSAM